MKISFRYLFFLLILATGSAAQRLLIIDFWTEAPLVNVMAIGNEDTLISTVNGIIDLKSFSSTPHTIILQKQGYYSKTIKFRNIESNIIKLTPVESSDGIEIFSERPGAPAIMTPTHITFLPAAELRESGILTLDRALETQAGIFLKSYGAAGQMQSLSLRGMSAEQTQLFIDGIPVNSMQLGSADPGQYDLQQIERVEIYRGGNARFGGGGTIGGVINMKSRRIPDSLQYLAYLRGESLQNKYAGFMLGLPTGLLNHDLSFNWSDGQNKYSVNHDSATVELKNRDFTRWNIRYRSAISVSQHFNADVLFYTYKFTGGSPAAFENPTTESRNLASISHDNNLAALSLHYKNNSYKINLRTFLRNEWTDYINPGLIIDGKIRSSNHFNHELGLSGNGQFMINDDLFINIGIETGLQEVRSSESGHNTRQRYAFFFKGEYELPWQFIDNWNSQLYGSLRTESYSDFGGIILPGMGLTIYNKNFKFYTSAGRNFRAPTFNELYWQPGGNPDLHPEKSINLEAGIKYCNAFTYLNIEFGAAFYYNRVKNQVRWIPVTSDIFSPQNILQVRSRGVEIHAKISDRSKQHQLIANYSYGKIIKTGSEFEGDATVGNRLPYIPAENWSLAFLSGIYKLRSGIQVSASGFRYLSFSNDPYDILPSYIVARCWAGFPVQIAGQNINLSAGVENLFDHQYQVTPGYPMPPRYFYMEFKLTN